MPTVQVTDGEIRIEARAPSRNALLTLKEKIIMPGKGERKDNLDSAH